MFDYLYLIYRLSPVLGLSPFASFCYRYEYYPPFITIPVNQYDKVKSMKYIDVPF